MIGSPSGAIKLLGGHKAVSNETGRKLTTVASWCAREAIPIEAWDELIAMAADKGIDGFSYEALVRAHAKHGRRKKGSASDSREAA